MMNILQISSNYHPEVGGPASSVPYLAGELIKEGHNVYVLTRDAKGYPNFEILEGIPVYRSMRIPGHFYNPVVALSTSFAMGIRARKIIDRHKIEIVHSHDINASAIAGIAGTIFKDVKKVTKFPGDLAWEFLSLRRWRDETPEQFLEREDISMRFLEFTQKTICDHYDKIIAPSEYMKKSLVKHSDIEKSKVDVVYNAIAVADYSEGRIESLRARLLEKSNFLVISACRMVPWKGIEYLIEAFKTLPTDIRLILVGDGPRRKELEKQAEGLNIKFLDKVPHRDIQAYIRASDLYVLPSVYEPSALALLDCLATQTPMIATDVGGTPEIITHKKTGLLIREKDSEAISNAIGELLFNKEIYEKIKKSQEVEYKRYLWENMIEKYIEVYERTMKE